MLEPREKEWVEAEDRRYAIYTDLPPGSYKFRVKACNNDGYWNEAGSPLKFAIVPRFTETPMFYALLGGGALASAIVLHRVRLAQQRRVQGLEHALALERERSRIAQDIHDDVGSSLTRIQLLSEVMEGEAANRATREVKAHAQEIAATARSVVQRMDEIVWAVNPENDTLASFVDYVCQATEELFQGTRIRCRFDIQERFAERELASEMRHDLFLLIKEALHNALKHSDAAEVTLRLREEKDNLAIEIEDGGRGFDSQSATTGGNGLRNMRERARKLGGSCEIQSNRGAGTKVLFGIPLV
jgi:signal transduction histidine kinase